MWLERSPNRRGSKIRSVNRHPSLDSSNQGALLVRAENDTRLFSEREKNAAQIFRLAVSRFFDFVRIGQRPPNIRMIGNALDFQQFLILDRLSVAEVKAQAVGFDQRAGLMNVSPQLLAQHRMKNMGSGMVALNIPTPFGVDNRQSRVAHAYGAAGDGANVRN